MVLFMMIWRAGKARRLTNPARERSRGKKKWGDTWTPREVVRRDAEKSTLEKRPGERKKGVTQGHLERR